LKIKQNLLHTNSEERYFQREKRPKRRETIGERNQIKMKNLYFVGVEKSIEFCIIFFKEKKLKLLLNDALWSLRTGML
jgi:hypothetical protein